MPLISGPDTSPPMVGIRLTMEIDAKNSFSSTFQIHQFTGTFIGQISPIPTTMLWVECFALVRSSPCP
jgi:hypothetical protein